MYDLCSALVEVHLKDSPLYINAISGKPSHLDQCENVFHLDSPKIWLWKRISHLMFRPIQYSFDVSLDRSEVALLKAVGRFLSLYCHVHALLPLFFLSL